MIFVILLPRQSYLCKSFMNKYFSCLIFISSLLFSACTKEQTSPSYPVPLPVTLPATCDTSSIHYLPAVKQIIGRTCAYSGCHFPGNGNYDFTSYAVVAERIRSGRFTERILLLPDNPLHMPQGFAMDSCDLGKLMIWINNGFIND